MKTIVQILEYPSQDSAAHRARGAGSLHRQKREDRGDPRGPEPYSDGSCMKRETSPGPGPWIGPGRREKKFPGFFHYLYQSSPRVPLQEVQ